MSSSYKNILLFATVSLLSLTTITGAFLLSSSAFAEDSQNSVITTTTVNVPEICTLGGTVDSNHQASLIGGTYSGTDFTNGIGQTTLKAFCNDTAGFAIYAIGYTNDEYGNNKLHWSGASSASDDTNAISTGIYTSGVTTDSTWSMKLASISGTYAATIDDGVAAHNNSTENFTNWHTVPTEYKRVAYRLSGTDAEQSGAGTGSSITTTYDAYVSATQPAGTYIGQVKYTLVHPSTEGAPITPLRPTDAPANSIIYAPNADDIIGDMSSLGIVAGSAIAGKQTTISGSISANITSSTTEIELIAPNYARSGYGFAGWSEDFEADNSSTIYGPNETITIEAGSLSTNGMILYPVWIASKGDMQEWTGCSGLTAATYDSTTGKVSATLNQLTALTDTRDGNVYTVARLADGECWMVENLRLNNEHTTSAEDIAKAQGYGTSTTYGNFIGLASSEDANFYNEFPTAANNNTNDFYSSDGSTSINIGSSNSPYSRMPRYNKNNTNMSNNATNSVGTTLVDSKNDNNNYSRWYSYGNYYSFPAAVASTIYYSSEDVNTSLCPKGWSLPLGRQSTGILENGANDIANRVGSFSYLDRMMGGSGAGSSDERIESRKWRSFPNNFVYSGRFTRETTSDRGVMGYYWTRSSNNYSYASMHSFRRDEISLAIGNVDKHLGSALRCISQ